MANERGRNNLHYKAHTSWCGSCTRILFNLIVIFGLFFSVELFYRTWLYFRNCDTVCYNITFFTKLDAFNREMAYTFLAADPTIGYLPADGTFVNGEPGGAKITIHEGVRVNPKFAPNSEGGAILVVGGSFVFGYNVSDNETWPAILEWRLNRRVINGGVSGYGPIQSVMRAQQLLKARAYSLLILSIVASDVSRDQYVNFSGFYRPAFIREDGKLRYTTVEESGRIVSENLVCAHQWVPELFFWSHLAKRFFVKLGYNGLCALMIHPKAASSDEIIEFAIDRFAALPVNKLILIQYPRYSFEINFGEATKIYNAAERHGVQVIDMYNVSKHKPLLEILKNGNEVVAGSIADRIAEMVP
jgi:hypothetical protein